MRLLELVALCWAFCIDFQEEHPRFATWRVGHVRACIESAVLFSALIALSAKKILRRQS
jgi:hypothetical protein